MAGKLRRQRHKKGSTKEISDDDSDTSSQDSITSMEIKVQVLQQDYTLENSNVYETMTPPSLHPDPRQPLYDKTSPPGWYLARREDKPTSFRSYQHKHHGDYISWGNRKEVFGKYPGSPGYNFTLDKDQEGYLKREERKRSCAVLFCKYICFLLLLSSFLLVIVLFSVFISQGKRMFGPL